MKWRKVEHDFVKAVASVPAMMQSEYEQKRQDKIRQNLEKLKGLNVPKLYPQPKPGDDRLPKSTLALKSFQVLVNYMFACSSKEETSSSGEEEAPSPARAYQAGHGWHHRQQLNVASRYDYSSAGAALARGGMSTTLRSSRAANLKLWPVCNTRR